MAKEFLKVIFGNISSANTNIAYKLDEINVASNWNPLAKIPKEMGGFNFSTNDKIFRWLVRGDTLYNVKIPKDAEVINCNSPSAPNGVFRTNKIIISNPREITDDMAMQFYKQSDLPERSYYKALSGAAIRGYKHTCEKLIEEKINEVNIDEVLKEINDFIKPDQAINKKQNSNEVYDYVMDLLGEIKSDVLISKFVDKKPIYKKISSDKVINVNGESGSGKSTFSTRYLNNDNYVVIDTDELKKDKEPSNKNCEAFKKYLNKKYGKNKLDACSDFEVIYKEILDYFKDSDKVIVIDSAQFRNIKDLSILKGEFITIRTSANSCYNRCINRFIDNYKRKKEKYTDDEFKVYQEKKKAIFEWYKSLNDFLVRLYSEV